MDYGTHEIRRVYRLDFNDGETNWDDPISPEVVAKVLGKRATAITDRTSLLAGALMNIPQVQVADLAFEGWIKISISPDADFDEPTFKSDIAALVRFIGQVRRDHAERAQHGGGLHGIAESIMSPISFAEMRTPL